MEKIRRRPPEYLGSAGFGSVSVGSPGGSGHRICLDSPTPFQTTPTTQVEPVAQAIPTATPINAEVPLLPPKGKGKVCNNRKKSIAWDHFEK